jgi:hypothetical protein
MVAFVKCAVCPTIMAVPPSVLGRKKYCCRACARKAWRGVRRSPATEFKPGGINRRRLSIGTERRRKGYVQVKVAEPNVWRQRGQLAWEHAHDRHLPEGWVIRRLDGRQSNDDPTNLEAVPRSEHLQRTVQDPAVRPRWIRAIARASRRRWEDYRMSKFDSFYWETEVA